MYILLVFQVLIAIALIGFVLVQKGQGATAGAAFGSGASGTVFGARGAGNFLSRTTWVLAALFCAISLGMAVIASRSMAEPETNLGVMGTVQEAPAGEAGQGAEPVVGPEAPAATDVPALEPSADSGGNTGDDVPVLDEDAGAAGAATSEKEEGAGSDSG